MLNFIFYYWTNIFLCLRCCGECNERDTTSNDRIIVIHNKDIRPASGAHADYGRQMIMGATLAIDKINAVGGILGSKLEMKFMDSQLKSAVAIKNVRHMVREW